MKKTQLVLASILLVISFSCNKQDIDIEENTSNSSKETSSNEVKFLGEEAYFNKQGEVKQGNYLGMDITYNLVEGNAVFEGDIILSKEDVKKLGYEKELISETPPNEPILVTNSVGRKAITRRWPNNIVHYEIADNLPNKSRVTNAIAEWETKTNIRFIKRTNQIDYVKFIVGRGCSSPVGRLGGVQYIKLASACSTGSTIHEIGHTLGLWHEQNRADRDKFIKIEYNNIKRRAIYNFKRYIDNLGDGKEYTRALDFNSIMMYSSYAFSKNGKPTITKLDGSTYEAQRKGLSSGDIEGISQMYSENKDEGNDDDNKKYKNGEYYIINRLRVYRYKNQWWYYNRSKKEWKVVINTNGKWSYKSKKNS